MGEKVVKWENANQFKQGIFEQNGLIIGGITPLTNCRSHHNRDSRGSNDKWVQKCIEQKLFFFRLVENVEIALSVANVYTKDWRQKSFYA